MDDGWLSRPANDDHGGRLLGFDQLDCDRLGGADLARGQLGNLGQWGVADVEQGLTEEIKARLVQEAKER
jgi:hypothetical protein